MDVEEEFRNSRKLDFEIVGGGMVAKRGATLPLSQKNREGHRMLQVGADTLPRHLRRPESGHMMICKHMMVWPTEALGDILSTWRQDTKLLCHILAKSF